MVNDQRPPPLSLGAMHPNKEEVGQKCQDACMDKQPLDKLKHKSEQIETAKREGTCLLTSRNVVYPTHNHTQKVF